MAGQRPQKLLVLKELENLPVAMSCIKAAWLHDTLFFGGGHKSSGDDRDAAKLYSILPHVHDSTTKYTSILTPVLCYALAMYRSQIVLVGGKEYPSGIITNKVWILDENGHTVQSDGSIPPMPTQRYTAAAVSVHDNLIVGGGFDKTPLDVVEVFNGDWKSVKSLPRPCRDASSTVYDGKIYFIGGEGQEKELWYGSIDVLVSNPSLFEWKKQPDVPCECSSTLTPKSKELFLSIGGRTGGKGTERCSAIYAFSHRNNHWQYVGDIALSEGDKSQTVKLSSTCSVLLPTGEILFIGGFGGWYSKRVFKLNLNPIECAINGSFSASSGKIALMSNTSGAKNTGFFKSFNGTSKVVSQYYQCAKLNVTPPIPFVDPITVLVCDHRGVRYTMKEHAITLDIPEGAIPKGVVVHIELGVSLYGPFSFPDNTRPISPILWLCPQEYVEFETLITVTLPHFLISGADQGNLSQAGVGFAKADHGDISRDCNNATTFNFQASADQIHFSTEKNQGFGSLITKHCCYICITAEQRPELAREAGYIFSRIDSVQGSPSSADSVKFITEFFVTFCLPTCLTALKMLRPEWSKKCSSEFLFGAADDSHLKVDVKLDGCKGKYLIEEYPKHKKIRMSDVDFWSKPFYDEKIMKAKHEHEIYPPKFTVKWTPVRGSRPFQCLLAVEVTGCADANSLDSDIILPFCDTKSDSLGTNTQSDLCDTESSSYQELTSDSHFLEIWKYLKDLDKSNIVRLGQALGLQRPNLKKMDELPDDMIDAWLLKKDNVQTVSGPPTWESLREALQTIEQNGISERISKDKKLHIHGQASSRRV